MACKVKGNTVRLGTIRGNGRTLALPAEGRDTHLYVCGGSGAGKSKLLEFMIRQDIKAWPDSKCGLLLLDPHGSVYQNVSPSGRQW
jgi:type IV secretory pathway VirB4 component